MPAPVRLVIPVDSQDPQAWALGAGHADAIAGQGQPAAREVILLTGTKAQLKHTSLAGHLGDAVAKRLLSNGTVGLPSGRPLRHATLHTLGTPRNAVILAYYADDRMLETLDGLSGIAGIVAVPDLPGQIPNWIARWTPAVHGQTPTAAEPLLTDPVIENALLSLSRMANLSHAIMHPRDKAYADEMLRILRARNHDLEPGKIKSWAIRNGWKPGAADELAKLAEKIQPLKSKSSLAKFHDPDSRYERWSK